MVKIDYQCFYYLSNVPCMNLIAHNVWVIRFMHKSLLKFYQAQTFFFAITQKIESFC